MNNRRQLTLYCFSPPVMLATFGIEIALILYAVWRYQLTRVTRLAATMFLFLAIFQLAEYMVCGGMGMNAAQWSRLGYASISMLPPLGIHLTYAIAGKSNRAAIGAGYAMAAAFISYFLLVPNAIAGNECMGNYVIFQVGRPVIDLYTLYYYGLLLGGVGLSWHLAGKAKPRVGKALHAFAAGYLLFMLPTATVNIINPQTIAGIPSIMCGFAVLLALVLAFWVLPAVAPFKDRRTRQAPAARR